MVNVTVNGTAVQVPEGTTILNAALAAGVEIPHLCYLKQLNEIGACPHLLRRDRGRAQPGAQLQHPVFEGMVIRTNTDRVRPHPPHQCGTDPVPARLQCATCVRSGNCQLQSIANDLGILENPYPTDLVTGVRALWPKDFPLYRDTNKCIKCMRCIQVCDKVQGVNVWDLSGTGSRTRVDVSHNRRIKASGLRAVRPVHHPLPGGRFAGAGRHLPPDAGHRRPGQDHRGADRPRGAHRLGREPGPAAGKSHRHRMAAVLRRLGFDYVFDTSFSADLTIMEEGTEFLRKFTAGETKDLPMFTSCCPGWVRYLKSHYPEWTDRLSTAKSPQQMFGAVAKACFANASAWSRKRFSAFPSCPAWPKVRV